VESESGKLTPETEELDSDRIELRIWAMPLQDETAERRQITGASFFFGWDFLRQS
jgi:hypothetical protein